MMLNRLLILILISSVILREDFSFLVAAVAQDASSVTWDGPGDAQIFNDAGVVPVATGPDLDALDENYPDDGEMPVILEFDLDFQAEEMQCPGDNKVDLGWLVHCLLHENDVFLSTASNSFCMLNRLRN